VTIYDISRPLAGGLANWPGDAPFRFAWTCRKADGASVNVGQVALSVHSGTHVDAPLHFDDAGAAADALPLAAFVGRARVIDVAGQPVIGREALEGFDLAAAPRVLLRTGAWPDSRRFPDAVPVLGEGVPAWLGERGVVLLGVDVPSVDALDSKTLPTHHALRAAGVMILEGLDLAGVPEGVYELAALPLKIAGADGAPVRAVLRAGG
jgi:arylformamidase